MEVILPGVSLVSSTHSLKDACTQTESIWSQTASNWPPTKLSNKLSDEVEELTSEIMNEVRELIELDKEIERLLLLKLTPTPTPQLLLNNETMPFVQPVAMFSDDTTSRTFRIPFGTNVGNEVSHIKSDPESL